MPLSEDSLEKLDRKLLEMALLDFERFCKIGKIDRTQAYICLELERGKSNGEIGAKLGKRRQTIAERGKRCK